MALQLSPWNRLSIMLKGKKPKLLLLVLSVAFIITLRISLVTDFSSWTYSFSETTEIQGYIDKVVETNYSTFGQRPINRYFFTFELEGEIYQNSSFSDRTFGRSGDKVRIEFVKSTPERSRVLNTKNGQFGLTPLLLAMAFISILAYFFYKSIAKSLSVIALLHNRVEDVGEYFDQRESIHLDGGTTIYTLEYRYKALDEEKVKYVDTIDPERFNAEEPLFYSKEHPEQAVLFKELPDQVLERLGIKILD